MKLPELINYNSIPDYHPHCEICGSTGLIIGDFRHTNFKGAFYDCASEESSHRFIDSEDDYFNIAYWYMSETQRKAFTRLSLGERRVFLKMHPSEQKSFIKLSRKKRQLYLLANVKYKIEVEDYDDFVNAEFYKYEEWS
ncbi:hypothetical protein [Spirosoma gilvum]